MAEKVYTGTIEVIFGPMFSGKSTELMRLAKRYTIARKKCLIVSSAKDNRNSDILVPTDEKNGIDSAKCFDLEEVMPIYKEYDVIAIDEGHFFHNVAEKAETFANNGKIVIVAALDATFQRKPFECVLQLLPIAEKVTKLSAVCAICAHDAAFSQRIAKCDTIELVGGQETYRPLCRKCYLETENKKVLNETPKVNQIDVTPGI